MMNKMIATTFFLLPCISYADDQMDYLVSKELAEYPAINNSFGDVSGPVKNMIIRNKNGDTSVFYNKNGRIENINIMAGLESYREYSYMEKDSKLPSELKISGPQSYSVDSDITYLRDNHGNLKKKVTTDSINGKIDETRVETFSYKKNNDGVVEVLLGGNSININGNKKLYYKNGLLIREVVENAKGINSKNEELIIPKFKTIYNYKFDKNGDVLVFKSKEVVNHLGVVGFKSWEKYSTEGNITERSTSSFDDINNMNSEVYTDYKLDKNSNWTERKKCEFWNNYKEKRPCTIESRTINYY